MGFICQTKSNRSNFSYPFNWLVMLNDYLPILRRRLKIFAYISVIYKYLWNQYLQFLNYRCKLLFSTAINGQTIVLEKALNVLFNNNGTEIMIVNIASNFQTLYIYANGEQLPVGEDNHIYRRDETIPVDGVQPYLFTRDEVELNADFIIKIPIALYSIINIQQLSAIVDQYKFVGTIYRIEQY